MMIGGKSSVLLAGRIEDYSRRKDIITSIQTDTQIYIVKFLEALVVPVIPRIQDHRCIMALQDHRYQL